ncbi:MAG TPA: deoxyribonuclease IV [Candidatus Bipolaricaulota bacterium]|nr:deoxyribonuclease IV [Candidatus Bipolaricaulota bacterium]
MLIGSHVSIAGGIQNAPINAAKIGCECFQFFSRSPRGGGKKDLAEMEIEEFKKNCEQNKLSDYYIHAPYYINLASLNNKIKHGSINACREELERGSLLGAKYMMTHLGSAGEREETDALNETVKSIDRILDGYGGKTEFLMEIAAGSGKILGDDFKEIAYILQNIKSKNVGVCFDTAHAFASGYDLRIKEAVNETLKKFDEQIGLDKLKLIHANDSLAEFNSHKDRHQHIGQGEIGPEGFSALINHPKLQNVNFIIETPKEDDRSDLHNIEMLKKMRSNHK